MARILVLGAGYVGSAVAARALAAGDEVVLADNWSATERSQAEAVRRATVADADIRSWDDLAALFASPFDRVVFTAAQASRPLSFEDPAYTEWTNLVGPRLLAEVVGETPVVYASSLHVYGGGLSGEVGADRPYGEQGDLAHLSKVYAELLLKMEARRRGFPLALLRLGIVYGPAPVMHDRPESVTVVDKFKRLAAAGEPTTLDDGGRATIGVVHVEDCARILYEATDEIANVAAETITVGDVAALAEGREPAGGATWTVSSPFAYEHRVAEYLAR